MLHAREFADWIAHEGRENLHFQSGRSFREPQISPGGIAGQFMGALYASHYLWVIFAFQVIAAVLLLVNCYVPLAVAVLAPVIVNILSFHALMAPSGLPLALFVTVLWALIFVDVQAGLCRVVPVAPAGRGLLHNTMVLEDSAELKDETFVP
jgi:hypothetical protein